MEVLRGIKERSPHTPVIVITAYGTVNTAVEAMKEGASDFIMKPFSLDKLEAVVRKAIDTDERPVAETSPERPRAVDTDRPFVTADPAMESLLAILRVVAKGRSSVLVEGESGTGKEMIARYLHRHSDRCGMPFVAVNCAAIPHNLLESEMFGYEKGAFTGAAMRKVGKFEQADGGTLLLDEIGEMDLGLQAKLLRAIQESEIDRVGGKEPVRVDVRIIATTNKDLIQAIKEQTFREDLYYRLNVIPVRIPPLRERKADILPLCDYFLEKYRLLNGLKHKPRLTDASVNELFAYGWPGNVRELENVMERSVLICGGEEITPRHLFWSGGRKAAVPETIMPPAEAVPSLDVAAAPITLREHEKRLIYGTLDRVGGNKTKASELLGVSVRTIRNKLNEYREEETGIAGEA